MDSERIIITEPLWDENLNELGSEQGKDFVEKVQDEKTNYEVEIVIADRKMMPTAISFSLTKRINVDFVAKLHKFDGYEYLHGFLLSSPHFKRVEVVNE